MGKAIETKEALKALVTYFDGRTDERVTLRQRTFTHIIRGSGVCKDVRTIERLWDELVFKGFIVHDKEAHTELLLLRDARGYAHATPPVVAVETEVGGRTHTHIIPTDEGGM